jgi:hypothetical protein
MLSIFAPASQFWRHGFDCVGTLLCHVFPTQIDQRQMTKKSALSNSHVAARQLKKRGPKEHDEQHLENDSSRRRLPCHAPAATTAAVMLPSDPQLLPLPPPLCCFHCHATAVTVLPQLLSPLPCPRRHRRRAMPCCCCHRPCCHALRRSRSLVVVEVVVVVIVIVILLS